MFVHVFSIDSSAVLSRFECHDYGLSTCLLREVLTAFVTCFGMIFTTFYKRDGGRLPGVCDHGAMAEVRGKGGHLSAAEYDHEVDPDHELVPGAQAGVCAEAGHVQGHVFVHTQEYQLRNAGHLHL